MIYESEGCAQDDQRRIRRSALAGICRFTAPPLVAKYLRENHESWIERVANYFCRDAADDVSSADCRLAAQFVIHLGLISVALYQDLPEDERPKVRERLLEGLVRFTMGGLPALTHERRSPSDSRNPDQEQVIE